MMCRGMLLVYQSNSGLCLAGSAAVRLGTDDTFMSKLADWCKTEDHEGVRGELSYLLTYLLDGCHSSLSVAVQCWIESCWGRRNCKSLRS